MSVRKTLFRWHRWLGLIAALPLLLISLSGAILVFKAPLDRWLLADQVALSASQQGQRLPLDQLLQLVHQQIPGYQVGSWELFDDGIEADRLYMIRFGSSDWFKAYLNPYSGEVLRQPVGLNEDFSDWLLQLHYTLLLDEQVPGLPWLGLTLGLLSAAALIVLGISGLLVQRRWLQNLWQKPWHARPSVGWRKLHRFSGAWVSPVLLVLGITGGYFNLMELIEEVGEDQHEIVSHYLYEPQLPLQQLYEQAQQQWPGYRIHYLLMPYESGGQLVFYGKYPHANAAVEMLASDYGSSVWFNPHSAELEGSFAMPTADFGVQLTDSFRALHFGSFGAFASQLIWTLSGLLIALLAISGCWNWLRTTRLKHQPQRPYQPSDQPSDQPGRRGA
ncbi:PepSY-associated TM helix domain-containing protein [Oceanobacter mangrovi]|uniref:PepSY-associated TM helix domain-containing protein n=1 Tax=Oceanobacter mangrovi TaxID=2862510 RepID=UPI001C8D9F51|nr:PepSY-associated TM helix domain-containing protein [Oceanobacter mangrovi]